MIHRLSQKIKEGTKFFVGHGDNTNSHDDRKPVGEVVSSFVKEIGGKLSSIIIGHFPDKEKITDMDVCSMEANIHTNDELDSLVDDIDEVSGVALGNSNTDHAAFPGAKRLNAIQCFNIQGKKDDKGKLMTVDEVIKAAKDLNIRPSQLFTLDDFKGDSVVGKIFTQNTDLKTANEKLTKDNKEITDKSTEAIRTSDVAKASEKLDVHLKEGFTSKQQKFIKIHFKPEDMEDLSDEKIKEFIEDQKKAFAEQAKLFGVTEDSLKTDESGDNEDSEEKSPEEAALDLMGVN